MWGGHNLFKQGQKEFKKLKDGGRKKKKKGGEINLKSVIKNQRL